MSENVEERITVTFTAEKLERLKTAKGLFENDVKTKIEVDNFIDMLVKTYLSYRNARGASESSLLEKLTER